MKVDVNVVSIPSFEYCLVTHVSLNLICNVVTEYIKYVDTGRKEQSI